MGFISFKKYLDLDPRELQKSKERESSEKQAPTVLEAYRALLTAVGSCGRRASPVLDFGLEEQLRKISDSLPEDSAPAIVHRTEAKVESHLLRWSEDAAGYLKQKADEVKDIIAVLVRAAESAAKRNQRYQSEFAELTTRLEGAATLDDLTQIRALVTESVTGLKTWAEEMHEEGRKSVAELQTEILGYQKKLDTAEALASRDSLTGLLNRRVVEAQLQRRVEQNRPFSIVMIDLDRFKQVNDCYGHLAGDNLLSQFGGELRQQSRSEELVGRWGGDEFIAILAGGDGEAQAYLERLEKWVFGTYTIPVGEGSCKVQVKASVGTATWKPGETIRSAIQRADAGMYDHKSRGRKLAR